MDPKIEVTAQSVHDVLRQPPASLARLLPEVFEKLRQPVRQTHRFMEVYTVRPTHFIVPRNKIYIIVLV